jgi:hypothetical protein
MGLSRENYGIDHHYKTHSKKYKKRALLGQFVMIAISLTVSPAYHGLVDIYCQDSTTD